MREILIINLKGFEDIFSSTHLIHSMAKDNPHQKISLLIDKEFLSAAKLIKHIHKIYTINSKEILTILGSDIFSNAFAVNSLSEALTLCQNTKWDSVINLSNDKISSYITSYITQHHHNTQNNTQTSGLRFDRDGTFRNSSDWSIIHNDIVANYPHTPLHRIDGHHFLARANRRIKGDKIFLSSKHNETAFKSISQMRAEKSSTARVVAVQVSNKMSEKNITPENFESFIEMLIKSPSYIPLLIVSPNGHERSYASEINKKLAGKLTTVEADFLALPSVLLNVDLLVTPDAPIKYLADLLETPLIEISLGPSPFLKQGTTNPESIILSPRPSIRIFEEAAYINNPELGKQNDIIKACDLYNAVEAFFSNTLETAHFSNNVSVYKPSFDSLGTNYKFINGSFDARLEIARQMSRSFLASYFEIDHEMNISYFIKKDHAESVLEWCEDEKKAVTVATKNLLAILRSIGAVRDHKRLSVDFLNSLDRLFLVADTPNISSIPILIFRTKVDEISKSNKHHENLNIIEQHIYQLKNDIQTVMRIVNNIQNKYRKIAFDKKFTTVSL